jgi:hypothetical protein
LGKKRKQEIGIFTNHMSIFSNNFFCFTVSILFIEKTNKVNFECVYDVGEVNIVCLIAFGNNMRMKDLRKCNLNTNRTINSLQRKCGVQILHLIKLYCRRWKLGGNVVLLDKALYFGMMCLMVSLLG